SADGGRSWTEPTEDPALIEPACQGSIVRDEKGRILFANPASTKRERLTVRLSEDAAKTWPAARRLWDGPAAYSCLAVLPDGSVGCLYERGEKNPYESIVFARFPLAWLSEGRDGGK